jgi:hypothetical protein
MENKYVLQKFVKWLNTLPEVELNELADLLSEPKVSRSLIAIIKNTIGLRDFEHNSTRRLIVKDKGVGEKSRVMNISPSPNIGRFDEVKRKFFEAFEDLSLFPTRKEIVKVMNGIFNCGLEYKNYKKRGRKDLIRKCWNQLSMLPKEEQHKKLKIFVDKISENNLGRNEYKELFRILSNHE